jgi:hypothetical protein
MAPGGSGSGISFDIEANSKTAQAVGQTVQQLRTLDAELRKMRASTDQSAEAATRIGAALAQKSRLTAELRARMSELNKTTQESTNFFGNKLAEAVRGASQALAEHSGPLAKVVTTLGELNIVGAIGVGALAALGVSAVAAAKQIGDFQERIDIAKDATGLTIKEIGGLTVAASNIGRSFESVESRVVLFARKIADAAEGNKALRETFNKVGVSVEDLKNKGVGEVLSQVAHGLESMNKETERSRTLFQFFGRSGATMLAILKQSSEETQALAERLGISLSPAMQEVARRADEAGDRMNLAFKGLANRVALALAPIGTAIINSITSALIGVQEVDHRTDLHNTIEQLDHLKKVAVDAADGVDKVNKALQKEALANREGGFVGALLVNTLKITTPRSTTAGGSQPDLLKYNLPNLFGDTTPTPEAKELDAIGKLISETEKLVAFQPTLLDGALERLAAAQATVSTQKDYNRLLEAAARINANTVVPQQQGPLTLQGEFVRGGGSLTEKREPGLLGMPTGISDDIAKFLVSSGQMDEIIKRLTDSSGKFNATLEQVKKVFEDIEKGKDFSQLFKRQVDDVAFTVGAAAIRLAAGKERFEDVMTQIVQVVLQAAAAMAAAAVGGPAGAFVGGAISALGGLVHFADGGTLRSGTRGVDNVAGLWQKGETVLDPSLTDALAALVPELRRSVKSPQPTTYIAPGALTVVVQGMPKGAALDDWLDADVLPAFNRLIGRTG